MSFITLINANYSILIVQLTNSGCKFNNRRCGSKISPRSEAGNGIIGLNRAIRFRNDFKRKVG